MIAAVSLHYRRAMASLRTHFERRAYELSDCATMDSAEEDGATTLRLRPDEPDAVGVVLYLGPGDHGTVKLDDQAAVPTEVGGNLGEDLQAIDQVIDTAVAGRAVAFHLGRGGCVEESAGGAVSRSWRNASPWPGWRRRARRVQYVPYR